MTKYLKLHLELRTIRASFLITLLFLLSGIVSGVAQSFGNSRDSISEVSYDENMVNYPGNLATVQNIAPSEWNLLGPTHIDDTSPYLLYYYKFLQVNSNSDRYESIIDINIQGDANYFQDQGTYRIRADKFQNTSNRFDGLEIRCISGNPKVATFYVYNNALWLRSNYKWGKIYYRTVGDFSTKSPLVGSLFGQTTTAPVGYIAISASYGLKCDFDNNIFYKLPYSDVEGNMLVNGNLGVGTATPQSKLAVNGTITATQVKVTQTGWPDYVFDEGYQLPDISETEVFIKANHRLPGMPSAKEVETNGLDLGEMQKKQMQKIEDLTLLLIRQQHEIDSLKILIRGKLMIKENPGTMK